MSRIKGFMPPPGTLPEPAISARLILDNSRMRRALIRIIEAALKGAALSVVEQLARDGLKKPMA